MYKYPTTSNEIFHYGIKRRSGRYPWGSGERPYQDLQMRQQKVGEYRKELSKFYKNDPEKKKKYESMSDEELYDVMERREMLKKVAITAAVTVGVVGAGYLIYKYSAMKQMSKIMASSKMPITGLTKAQMDKIMNESADDTAFVLKKGAAIFRQDGFSAGDFSNVKNPMYFAVKESDRQIYKGFLKDWHGTGQRYEHIAQLTKDLKIPKREEAERVFESFVRNNPEYLDKFAETFKKTPMYEAKLQEFTAIYRSPIKGKMMLDSQILSDVKAFKMNPDGTNRKWLFDQAWYQIVKQGDDSKMLVGEFKKRGYDAFIDFHDQFELADMPLIILDPSSTTKGVQTLRTFDADKIKAQQTVRKMLSEIDLNNKFVKPIRPK